MSDEQNNADQSLTAEKEKKIVISPDDCNAALDFWRHFNIPIPKEFQDAMDAFAANPSIENQDRVKLEVCRAIAHTDHEAFKDEMFSKIVDEARGVSFDMQFDKDFEAEVSQEE